MSFDLFVANLLSPPVLFFLLGVGATIARSDLEIPEPIAKLFSIYLLWAIGFKGGVALRESGIDPSTLTPLAAVVVTSALVPLAVFPLLRARLGVDNACAVAAAYGSVSVVTFITAADFIETRGIAYGGGMIAALALMESPPIVVALMLRAWVTRRPRARGTPDTSIAHIVRDAFTSGPIFLLLGSLAAGLLTGPKGFEPLRAFSYDIFHGVLVLFLLESGMVAGRRLPALKNAGPLPIVAAVAIPLANAAVGVALAYILGVPTGDALLLTILMASASYIAAPAVMRLAVPNANAGLYLTMSLAVTFPFNVCIGIPLYLSVIKLLWSGP